MLKIPNSEKGKPGSPAFETPDPNRAFGNEIQQISNQPNVPQGYGGIGVDNTVVRNSLQNMGNTLQDIATNLEKRDKALTAAEEDSRLLNGSLELKKRLPDLYKEVETHSNLNKLTPDEQKELFNQKYEALQSEITTGLKLTDKDIIQKSDLYFKETGIDVSNNYVQKVIEPRRIQNVKNTITDNVAKLEQQAIYAEDLNELQQIQNSALESFNAPYVQMLYTPEELKQLRTATLGKIQNAYATKFVENLPEDLTDAQAQLHFMVGENSPLNMIDATQRLKLLNYGERLIEAEQTKRERDFNKQQLEAERKLQDFQETNWYQSKMGIRSNQVSEKDLLILRQKNAITERQHLDLLNDLDGLHKNITKEDLTFNTVQTKIELGIKVGKQSDVDAWYKGLQKTADQIPQENKEQYMIDQFSKVGKIPTDYKDLTIGMLNSDKPEIVQVAVQRLRTIQQQDPRLMASFSDRERIVAEQANTGVSTERFMKKRDVMNNLSEAELTVRKEKYNDLVKKEDGVSRLDTMFDEYVSDNYEDYEDTPWYKFWTDSEPQVPDKVRGDYRESFKRYYLLEPDEKIAHKLAQQDLKQKVGRSTVGGIAKIMYNSPELVYGAKPEVLEKQIRSDLKPHGLNDDDNFNPHFGGYTKQGIPFFTFTKPDQVTGLPELIRGEDNLPVKFVYDPEKTEEYQKVVTEYGEKINKYRNERDQFRQADQAILSP